MHIPARIQHKSQPERVEFAPCDFVHRLLTLKEKSFIVQTQSLVTLLQSFVFLVKCPEMLVLLFNSNGLKLFVIAAGELALTYALTRTQTHASPKQLDHTHWTYIHVHRYPAYLVTAQSTSALDAALSPASHI
jgi:hypothetical protein